MNESELSTDTISKLSALMRQTFGDIFKSYYEGDPAEIPEASLPCIIIEKVNTGLTNKDAPTGQDSYLEQINIRLVLNKMDDVGASDDVDLTERKLRRYIEAIDPTTGTFAAGTALQALRTNFTLGNTQIENDIDIHYDIQPRPNMQVTSEGLISIITKSHINIPFRS